MIGRGAPGGRRAHLVGHCHRERLSGSSTSTAELPHEPLTFDLTIEGSMAELVRFLRLGVPMMLTGVEIRHI